MKEEKSKGLKLLIVVLTIPLVVFADVHALAYIGQLVRMESEGARFSGISAFCVLIILHFMLVNYIISFVIKALRR